MKRIFFFFLSSALLVNCSSQYGIIKAQAFVQNSIAGTIRVDENGRPMNSGITTQHLIYVETKTKKPLPKWETAWVEQKPYSIQAVEVTTINQVIGKTKDGKDVLVGASDGHQLWQLVLTPASAVAKDSVLKEKIMKNVIVLTGTWKNKSFTYQITKEQQLQTLHFQ